MWISPPLKDESLEAPPEVDEDFRRDFTEAAQTLRISPRASAALSRYCLQKLLHQKGGVQKRNLAEALDEIIESKSLPSYLADAIDAIRNIGNFAAHPLKDLSTGDVVEVEVAEAEWLLEILSSLFDFYFVQPAQMQKRKDELNQKLKALGKPPMK